jgi:hypothetical protein
MMIRICVLAISVLPTFLFAQFNDSTNYYVNYSSTGIVNKTNDGMSYVLNNALKFNVYKNNFSLNTLNSWIYGEQLDKRSNNDFHSVADLNVFKSERNVYYWALVNYETAYSLKINYRLQSGAGVGYYLIDKDNFVIQLSDGVLYEKSDLFDTEISNNDYETYRNSLRIKFRLLINEVLTFESSDFLQHSLEDRRDYVIKSSTTLGLKLRKWLSFSIVVNYNKLSITGRENLLCNLGLTAERFF